MSATSESVVLRSLGVSDAEIESVLAEAIRDRYDTLPEMESVRPGVMPPDELARLSGAEIRAMVSTEAYQKTIAFETGGRDYYDKRLRWPTWPGASSGITIGVGYDLGYHAQSEVTSSWGDLVVDGHLRKLLEQVGFKTDGTGVARETKVTIAKQRAEALRRAGIEIPWETAEVVFVRATLPKYARMVLAGLAHARELSPDSFGALFSLVFNRGASFHRDGDRFTEMRAIARHMLAREYDRIPGEIRAMKRLWGPELSGLHKRRDAEAELFAKGLRSSAVVVAGPTPAPVPIPQPGPGTPAAPIAPVAPATPVVPDATLTPVVGFEAARLGEAAEDLLDREADGGGLGAALPESARGVTPDQVRWPDDAASADYRHILERDLSGRDFSFTAKDLALLIAANRFAPLREEGRVLFALRGCRLAAERAQVDVDRLELIETRPDHRNLRCVVGVWNTTTDRLSAFPSSTVPEYTSVYGGYVKASQPKPEWNGNLLTTGCYPYVVGTHGNKRRVPGCFLQGTSVAKRARVLVQRTHADLVYRLDDVWDACVPHDNLHPAFRNDGKGFSSEGCLTVRGNLVNGVVTGDFVALRQVAGIGGAAGEGRRFDLVLLTGLEAAIAANLRERGLAGDDGLVLEHLGRLRQGSTGEEVHRLQAALGRPETGTLDADDRHTLLKAQQASGQPGDAVFSPMWDRHLGLRALAAPAVSVPKPESVGARRPAAPLIDNRTSETLGDHLSRVRAGALVRAGESSLLYELGLRSSLAAEQPEAALGTHLSARSLESAEFGMDDLAGIGRRILRRIERDLYQTLCGNDPEDEDARRQMIAALDGVRRDRRAAASDGPIHPAPLADPDAVVRLSKALVGNMGVMPMLAQPLAALILGRVAAATMAETCAMWATRFGDLPPPVGRSPVGADGPDGFGGPDAPDSPSLRPAINEAEIARYLRASPQDLTAAIASVAPGSSGAADGGMGQAQPEGMLADIFGQSVEDRANVWLLRAEAELHRLLCSDGTAARKLREEAGGLLAEAFDIADRPRAVRAVATLLVTYAGASFLPALAVPVAVVLVSRVLKATLEETCTMWSASLAVRQGGGMATASARA